MCYYYYYYEIDDIGSNEDHCRVKIQVRSLGSSSIRGSGGEGSVQEASLIIIIMMDSRT